MLVLSRRPGERIVIGDNIIIDVVRIGPNVVRLGVSAPINLPINRGEIHEKIQREKGTIANDNATH